MSGSVITNFTWEQAVLQLIADPDQRDFVRENYFDDPIEAAAERFRLSAEWQSVREVLGSPVGAALDLGAGNGIVSYALAIDGWKTTALEPDSSNVVGTGAIRRLAEKTGAEIEMLSGFGEAIPAANDSFDLVVARQVLHHAQNLGEFCKEIARVLKPGGRVFAYRDHVISGPNQLQQFLDGHPLHNLYGGENAYTEGTYRNALVAAGLSVNRQWRQFRAPFNYAPKCAEDISLEVMSRLLPTPLARKLAPVLGSRALFPLVGLALSTIDRRPGRLVGFYAEKRF
jgi:SAM-dependent methyltransferase